MIEFEYDEVKINKQFGVSRYYLDGVLVGKSCNGCGQEEPVAAFNARKESPDKIDSKCRTCKKSYYAEWVADKREARNEDRRAWDRAHPERVREKARKRNSENPGWHRVSTERNLARTPEQIASAQREAHPEGFKWCHSCSQTVPVSSFQIHRGNRDGLQARCVSCRAAQAKVRYRVRENSVFEDLGMNPLECFYCELPIYDDDELHSDHVVASALGGPDSMENRVPTCRSCNVCKNDKHFLDFLDQDFPYVEDQERILYKLKAHEIDWALPRRSPNG